MHIEPVGVLQKCALCPPKGKSYLEKRLLKLLRIRSKIVKSGPSQSKNAFSAQKVVQNLTSAGIGELRSDKKFGFENIFPQKKTIGLGCFLAFPTLNRQECCDDAESFREVLSSPLQFSHWPNITGSSSLYFRDRDFCISKKSCGSDTFDCFYNLKKCEKQLLSQI